MDFKFNNCHLDVFDHGGYESRNKSMLSLIKDAWETYVRNDKFPEPLKYFQLYTDDNFNPYTHFCFAVTDRESSVRGMPHFLFEGWPECGIPEYMEVFGRMVEAGGRSPESDRALWAGAVLDEYPWCQRRIGLAVAKRRPDLIDFRPIEWKSRGLDQFKHTPGFVPLPKQCENRVLVDFGGVGFSARLPLLLASGRPVVVAGRPQEAWFWWDGSLRAWEHYVPCGSKDGADLTESSFERALEWTFENREEAAEIGRRGMEYALANLTRSAAVRRIGHMMSEFSPDMFSGIRTRLLQGTK
jgi:hypothetical protein